MVSFMKFTRIRNWARSVVKRPRKNLTRGFFGHDLRRMRAKNGVGRPPHINRARAAHVPMIDFLDATYRRIIILLPPFSKHRAMHVAIGTAWLRKSNRRRGKA